MRTVANSETTPTGLMMAGGVPYPVAVQERFESYASGESLLYDNLELICEIYNEPSIRRSDLTSQLFLLGKHAQDPNLRERFMNPLDASIPALLRVFSRTFV